MAQRLFNGSLMWMTLLKVCLITLKINIGEIIDAIFKPYGAHRHDSMGRYFGNYFTNLDGE